MTMPDLIVRVKNAGRIQAVLAILSVLCLMFCVCLLSFVPLRNEGVKEALMLTIGIIGSAYKDVYGYFFGSSSSSDKPNQP